MKIFSLSALARGLRNFFHHGLNPFLAALVMVFKKGVKLVKKKKTENFCNHMVRKWRW